MRKPAQHIPGEIGVWGFIFGEIMVFSLFFCIFLYHRGQNVGLFLSSQSHLNQAFGALNTFFMLSSSWFVAMGVHAARKKPGKITPFCFISAFLCGLGFGVVKIFEYGEKIRAGITVGTDEFYRLYFMSTGIHLMHVVSGMVVLALMARYSWSGGLDAKKIGNLESGASFWHMVDLLWIVLFALLYLVK